MATDPDSNAAPMNFQSILQLDVPKGRDGKHKLIVTQLLSDISQLVVGTALKIPLSAWPPPVTPNTSMCGRLSPKPEHGHPQTGGSRGLQASECTPPNQNGFSHGSFVYPTEFL